MESTYTLTDSLGQLHQALFTRFRKFNVHLHAITPSQTITSRHSATPTITYLRLPSEAQAVERLIGLKNERQLEVKHHPVIELRLNADWLALELVLTPEAWYDQRNWLGKMSVPRYREEFHNLLTTLSPHIRVGAWQGDTPTDRYLTSAELRFPRIFEAWAGTYSDGRDWLRFGVWYQTAQVTPDVAHHLFDHAQAIYRIHQYIAWTGRNDFYGLFRAKEDRDMR